MTSTLPPSIEPGQDSSGIDTSEIRLPYVDAAPTQLHGLSFGQRLHAAREARELDMDTCAFTLKLPARVLRKLERDEYDGIDSKLYLRSYISTYGRYLGINEASIQVELDRIKQIEPPLVATGGVSHSRFLLDRYATAATYVVLTAVIVVPMVWFGIRGTLNRDLSHLAPLDAAPVTVASTLGSARNVVAKTPPPATPAVQPEQPLMASMAAFPDMDSASAAQPSVAKPAVASETDGHSLSLHLVAASWVEVIGQDGTRLEYSLLPAGTDKTWHSDQPLDVRIGNASGAQVSIDGQPIELDNFRHANVAHFSVQLHDGKASAASF